MQSTDPVAPHADIIKNEPFIRLPPVTTTLFVMILLVQTALTFWSNHSGNQVLLETYFSFGFIPALFLSSKAALPTILTAGFVHGGWFHLGVNGAMLLACGSGVEKLGGKAFLLYIFLGGILLGNLAHLALFPTGTTPLIGASGGISALFGTILVLSIGSNMRKLLLWLLLFAAIGVIQWFMGGPNGESIGVFAHMGGFIFGVVSGLIFLRLKRSA